MTYVVGETKTKIIKLPCSISSPSTTNTWVAQIFVRYQLGDRTNKIHISLFWCCNRKCLNTIKDTWYEKGKEKKKIVIPPCSLSCRNISGESKAWLTKQNLQFRSRENHATSSWEIRLEETTNFLYLQKSYEGVTNVFS